MVVRLFFVAVASSFVALSAAFSPNMLLNNANNVGLYRGSSVVSFPSVGRSFQKLALRMSETSKDAAAAREIDFSKVGFNDGSESGFSGMIFRPEDSEEPESRCRVDWDVKCEKVRHTS
jgi:hypothetical protein